MTWHSRLSEEFYRPTERHTAEGPNYPRRKKPFKSIRPSHFVNIFHFVIFHRRQEEEEEEELRDPKLLSADWRPRTVSL